MRTRPRAPGPSALSSGPSSHRRYLQSEGFLLTLASLEKFALHLSIEPFTRRIDENGQVMPVALRA